MVSDGTSEAKLRSGERMPRPQLCSALVLSCLLVGDVFSGGYQSTVASISPEQAFLATIGIRGRRAPEPFPPLRSCLRSHPLSWRRCPCQYRCLLRRNYSYLSRGRHRSSERSPRRHGSEFLEISESLALADSPHRHKHRSPARAQSYGLFWSRGRNTSHLHPLR